MDFFSQSAIDCKDPVSPDGDVVSEKNTFVA